MRESFFPVLSEESLMLPVFLESIGVRFQETGIFRDNGYPVYQWLVCQEGEGQFFFDGEEMILKKGHGLFIKPGIKHGYVNRSKKWTTSWIAFDGMQIQALLNRLGFYETEIYNLKDPDIVLSNIRDCYNIATLGIYDEIEVSKVLYSFLIDMKNRVEPINQRREEKKTVQFTNVLSYIDQHYHKTITLEELARFLEVTEQYVCRLFKKYLKKRPMTYINEVRIQKSKAMLIAAREVSIENISKATGFLSPSYFGKQFRRFEGKTPGEFRRMYRS